MLPAHPQPSHAFGIRAKVGILVAGLVLVAAGFVGFLTHQHSSTALVEAALEGVHATARSAAGSWEHRLEEIEDDLRFLASTPAARRLAEVVRTGPGERSEAYHAALDDLAELARLRMDTQVTHRALALQDSDSGRSWLVQLGQSAGDGWNGRRVHGGAENERGARWSPVVLQDGSPRVEVSLPVEGSSLRLILHADLSPVLRDLGAELPRGRDLVVVDPQGRFLVHPDPAMLAGGSTRPPRLADVHPHIAATLEAGGALAPTLVRRDRHGVEIASSIERVAAPGGDGRAFAVAVLADYDQVVAGARSRRQQTLIFLAVLVVVATLLGWRIAESIAAPLDEIAQRVRAFEEGDDQLALPVDAPGEAGVVARGFTRLVRQAEDRSLLLSAEIEVRQSTEEALRQSEARFRSFYDDSPAVFLSTDAAGRVQSINAFGASRLGYRVADLLGRPHTELLSEDEREESARFLHAVLRDPEELHVREARMLRREGTTFWLRLVARVQDEDGGRVIHWVGEDTSRTHELREDLAFRERHDALTGLPNRRELERRLAVLTERAAREREHVLVLLDLDQFKVVNDTCGHAAGDELLRHVARVLDREVDPPHLLARLGGDEFAVLFEGTRLEDAERKVEQVRESLRLMEFENNGQRYTITASIGVVQLSAAGRELGAVLSLADTMCFAAKEGGRDRVQVYQEGDAGLEQLQEQMRAVSMITRAFEEDRFRLHRQAIVPVSGPSEGDHFEILIRMEAEDGSLVPPGVFLQSAERYGLAPRIDRWVVGSTLDWLEANPAELERLSMCSINLSGQSLGDEELLALLDRRLAEGRIPPQKLCFEITETAAVANLEAALRFIERLRRRGCLFALDDFGSGMSSFGYLRNLPVDLLKIDGMFVRDVAVDPTAFAMVRAIHQVGRVMGMRTVAEFVEDEAILRQLRRIGVDYAQGYGIGKPHTVDEPLLGGAPGPAYPSSSPST